MISIDKDSLFVFLPTRLEIKERPELNVFPFNVFVSSHGLNEEGKMVVCSVFYDPDLSTYKDNGDIKSLSYKNIFNQDYKLIISFNAVKNTYSCAKYNKDKIVGCADGENDWKRFFLHVGLLGFAKGETYLFDEIKQTN